MLYAAKCYWPGITTREFEHGAAGRLARAHRWDPAGTSYVGSILFGDDQLLLCLFDGGSTGAVRHSADRARIPCERVMALVWLPASRRNPPCLCSTAYHNGGRKC
jgi:hypothetical protein